MTAPDHFDELSPTDLLANAKNRLRGLQTDLDNISLTGDQPEREQTLKEDIIRVQKIRDDRQKAVDKLNREQASAASADAS